MKSTRVVASLDPKIAADLELVASQTPFKTGNMLLAAAGAELAKLKKPDGSIHNIWHALARIADVSNEEGSKRLPGARPVLEIAR